MPLVKNDTPVKPTTYRDMQKEMQTWNDEQLDSTLTVEIESESECYAAEVRICGEEHDSLDPYHPVIFIR